MKQFYLRIFLFCCFLFQGLFVLAQNCLLLTATIQANESRCASTGSISITASGGSGSYKYKVEGPVNTDYTSATTITGLSAGTYTVIVTDIASNCTFTQKNVIIPGSYLDPRFSLQGTDVTCDNGSNGSIQVVGLEHGISPFTYTIVAPSPSGVGHTNTTGIFENLPAGDYSIQLQDSCGGIQTRTVRINNFSWKIDSHSMIKFSCDSARGTIIASDNRGNTSEVQGLEGFTYGYVNAAGDSVWSTDPELRIGAYGLTSVTLLVKDPCGQVKTLQAPLSYLPSLGNEVLISNKSCSTYSASVSDIIHFTSPVFQLYQNETLIETNSTGAFSNLAYGRNYCIRAYDACSDSTISRCFVQQPDPLIADEEVSISNKTCEAFDVRVTGLQGFTNPTFILTKEGVFKGANISGQFVNLPYGNYCILILDGCRDTTVMRCFEARPPVPRVDPVIVPSYITCVDFGLNIGGDSLTRPQYCLYDTANVLIACNTTGIFDHIPLGSYCVTIHDDCMDTTFVRCFNVEPPVLTNDVQITLSNQTCSTFTASVATQSFANGNYCLYSIDDVLIRCDSTGRFTMLPYGEYYITSTSACPDTTVRTYFTASPPKPKVSTSPTLSNKTCSTFSARITGQQNLTNPTYYLLNSANDTIAKNTTGRFDNLPYADYCIVVENKCYDTTLKVCFTATPTKTTLKASAAKSCNYGTSRFAITVSGNLPARVQIINPMNQVIYNEMTTSSSVVVENIPNLPPGQKYTILATDNCGKDTSMQLAPVTTYLNHSVSVTEKCPGSVWPNGSGNIITTATTNSGTLTVRIIKKNNVALSPLLSPNSASGGVYSFNDLGPGTYIVRYNTNDGCNIYLYDTVVIAPYQFPTLTKSSAYQCDTDGFSVGAVVSNGVGPFSYAIIGSIPEVPSIIAGPQNSPVFNIDNGNTYSLIRLRAMDACGNATLGDASILPLADNKIFASANCFDHPVTLWMDSMYNSNATWYKKTNIEDTDSTEVGTGFSFHIDRLLPQDTGIYISHLKINSGCIERTYYIHLTGNCFPALPVQFSALQGRTEDSKAILTWDISNGKNIRNILIEKKSGNAFIKAGEVRVVPTDQKTSYQFIDQQAAGANYYRLKVLLQNGQVMYSNVVMLQQAAAQGIIVYPNPATDKIQIEFLQRDMNKYQVSVINMLNQTLKKTVHLNNGEKLIIPRNADMVPGMYILHFLNLSTHTESVQKIIFK